MTGKRLVTGVALALCCCWAGAASGGAMPDPGTARHFAAATLAKVIPGRTTKAQIKALLGPPWRITQSFDPDEPGPEIWEYRGQGAQGTYRIHIEFDKRGIAVLIAKIPDKGGEAPARVAKTPPALARP